MADVVKLNDDDLDAISGGALRWTGEGVWCVENPGTVYQFSDYKACADYIKAYWGGAIQTEETLQMLEAAGLVWRA